MGYTIRNFYKSMFRVFLLSALLLFYVPNANAENRVTAQLSHYNSEQIVTVYGTTEINDTFSIKGEVDSTGYLEIGGSYGKIIGRYYIDLFGNYGRAEVIDIYDLGVLGAMVISNKLTLFFNTTHEWRKTKGYPILELEIFDQREWNNSLGAIYKMLPSLEVSYAFNHDRLLSGNRGINEVENDNINSHTLTLTYKLKWFDPFIKYTNGQHRVRPGEPITRSDSVEIGARAKF